MKSRLLPYLLTLATVVPAQAGYLCNDSVRATLKTTIDAMAEGTNKVSAMTEWGLSAKAMHAGNVVDCEAHMLMASDFVTVTPFHRGFRGGGHINSGVSWYYGGVVDCARLRHLMCQVGSA